MNQKRTKRCSLFCRWSLKSVQRHRRLSWLNARAWDFLMSTCRRMTIWHMNQQMANFYQMTNTKHLRSWILIMKHFVARKKLMNSKEWKRRSESEGKPIFMSVVNELRRCRVIPACLAVLPKEVTVRHNCFYAIPLVRLGLIAQSLYLHGRTQKRARKREDVRK